MDNDLEFKVELKERLMKIEMILENMDKTNSLERMAIEEKIKVANNRIKDLEDNQKWLWRAIAGALISSIIAFLAKVR